MDMIRASTRLPRSPLKRAEERLSAVEREARSNADEATLTVVACARAIQQAVPDAADARLKIVEETLRAIETASAATVGLQAQIATRILDHVDAAWPTLAARREGARRAVLSLAERAETTGAAEARNVRYLADIAAAVESPENLLSRMADLEPADVDRLSWFVDAAHSGALEGVVTVGHRAQGARVVNMGLDAIRRNGGNPHLERMEDWQTRMESPMSRLFVRYHTLEMIHDGVPSGPEAGLILAQKLGRWAKLPPEDKAAARQAAVDEALSAAPEGELRRWLDFHQAARDIPHARPMLDMVLNCVMWGASPEPAFLDFALHQALREVPPGSDPALWKAFDALTGACDWRTTVERYTALAADCEKAAPAWEVPMLERALEGAREATDPSARLLLELLDAPPAPGTDRREHLRQGLDRLLRVGKDRMQDAITHDAAEPGGIKTEDDFVIIGNLRVPRRAVSR